jgi:mannose-6-phosphate isomerase-like protein (cupin superfamily)
LEKLNIFEVEETGEGVVKTPAGFSIRINRFTEKGNVVFLYYPPGTRNELHAHDDLEAIFYIVRGEGEITIGNKTEKAKEGDILFTPLNTPHQVVNSGKETLIILEVTFNR